MMLSRCPACSTTFRVSPEQLKARAGKVRCGQCQSQFNALDTLIEENIFSAIDVAGHEIAAQPAEDVISPVVEETGAGVIEESSGATEAAMLSVSLEKSESLLAAGMSLETQAESGIHALPEESPDATKIVSPKPAVPKEPYDTAFDAAPDNEEETKHRRWPWVIGIVFALLVLAAQATLHYRVELAVLQPALKPVLLAACKSLECEVPLPQHAEFLGIEASDLHPDPQQKGRLVLAATLINRAPFAQELPTIELTLNDVSDRPLIVKDLNPRDYLSKETNVAKGFAINGEIAVNLTLDVGDVPAAGYRIYLFYP